MKKQTALLLNLTPELRERLEKEATYYSQTLSGYIRNALIQHMDARSQGMIHVQQSQAETQQA